MILDPNRTYTFHNYFELKHPTGDVLAELGYGYQVASLALPVSAVDYPLDRLRDQMRNRLPQVPLTSETARREFYVAPVLMELLDILDVELLIEYPVDAGDRLRGDIDYVLRGVANVIVVEAKRADIDRGFTQMAVELIALSAVLKQPPQPLYGAVTTGNLWRFGRLDQHAKLVTKDTSEHLLPDHLERLFGILVHLVRAA